jgi:hypothetical protein
VVYLFARNFCSPVLLHTISISFSYFSYFSVACLLEALVQIFGVVQFQAATMMTRSKNKPAAKQVPNMPTDTSFALNPVTEARTHNGPDPNPPLDHALRAPDIAPVTPAVNTIAARSVVSAPTSSLPEASVPVAPLALAHSGSDSSAPGIVPDPSAPDLCAIFQQYMTITSELHLSTVDATTFRQTMEHGLYSIKMDICDSLVDRLKQASIVEDTANHPTSSRATPRATSSQRPGQY